MSALSISALTLQIYHPLATGGPLPQPVVKLTPARRTRCKFRCQIALIILAAASVFHCGQQLLCMVLCRAISTAGCLGLSRCSQVVIACVQPYAQFYPEHSTRSGILKCYLS